MFILLTEVPHSQPGKYKVDLLVFMYLHTTAIIYSPYGGLEDDPPGIEDTEAEDIDMLMNPVSTRPLSQRDTSALVRLTGKFCLRYH